MLPLLKFKDEVLHLLVVQDNPTGFLKKTVHCHFKRTNENVVIVGVVVDDDVFVVVGLETHL